MIDVLIADGRLKAATFVRSVLFDIDGDTTLEDGMGSCSCMLVSSYTPEICLSVTGPPRAVNGFGLSLPSKRFVTNALVGEMRFEAPQI